MQKNEKTVRFNEVYKLLLGLLTVLISFSAGFLREISSSLLALYVIALFLWCLGTLLIKGEFVLKSLGWYWLNLSLFSALYRIFWSSKTIGQPVMATMGIVSLFLFLAIIGYLSPYIGRKTKILEIILVLLFTAIFIPTNWQ